jgi:hypothetical protein
MLVSLFDEINKKLKADGVQPDGHYNAIVKELNTHFHRIQELQRGYSRAFGASSRSPNASSAKPTASRAMP